MTTHHFMCFSCGKQVDIESTQVVKGVITWPIVHCEDCPGNPQMLQGPTQYNGAASKELVLDD